MFLACKAYLMWISIYDRLFLELELAGVLATAFDSHGAIVITVNFSQYDIVNGSSDLAPLKRLPILKL